MAAIKTALDTPIDALDEQEQYFVSNVRDHGWFRTTVFEDDEGAGFSYSTGFWSSIRQPDLVMFGIKAESVHDIFWDLFRDAKSGKSLPVGKRTNAVFANLSAYAFPVAEKFYEEYLGWSCWFYNGNAFPCLQIIWPDRQEKFPWETGFDADFIDIQPDLTEQGWASLLSD